MPKCTLQFRETEWVTRGEQFGWSDAPACEDELIAHLTHDQADQKSGHEACRFSPQRMS